MWQIPTVLLFILTSWVIFKSWHKCVWQLWALFNEHGRPNWYAVIHSRTGDRFSEIPDATGKRNVTKTPLHIEMYVVFIVSPLSFLVLKYQNYKLNFMVICYIRKVECLKYLHPSCCNFEVLRCQSFLLVAINGLCTVGCWKLGILASNSFIFFGQSS